MKTQQSQHYTPIQQVECQQQLCDNQQQIIRCFLNNYAAGEKNKVTDYSHQQAIPKQENQNSVGRKQSELHKSKSRENRDNNANQSSLKLSNQNIKVISGINHYINIQEIDLSHNQIIKIQNIDRLIMLTTLDLSFNKIAIIENLTELLNLQSLDISHNQIKVFPKLLTKNHNLRTLNLSYNYIENEDCFNFLNKFIHLKNLDLSENPISKLEHYQSTVTNSVSTLTHLDGQQLHVQQQLSINQYLEDKENMKNLRYSSQLSLMNDQEFKKLLKNHDKNQSSLGYNLAQMITDMAIANNQPASNQTQIPMSQATVNTFHLDFSQINKSSTQSLSRDFQSVKRIPFKEIKQSDQKNDSFSYQYLINGNPSLQNYSAKSDSNIKINNFLSSHTSDNIIQDAHSNTQFTDMIQMSSQHSPRDDFNSNQKREEIVQAKLQKSEDMKNQCIGYLESWENNNVLFNEQINLLFLQNQLFKEWIISILSNDGVKNIDVLQSQIFSELIEKIHSLFTLTTQTATLLKKQKSTKIQIIQRLEKFLKQSFHPQEITKKVIELLEIPKKATEEQEEIMQVQRNCEQLIFVIHNMKLKLLKESKDSKSSTLIGQIYKNIIDQNNLYLNIKKVADTGKLLSSSIFSKFLLFFKYHIKDSSECMASIQGEIDLNESLRDLLFNKDDNFVQKYVLPYDNQMKSNKKSHQTPLLHELDAYLQNIMDEDFIIPKQRLSSNTGNSNSISKTSQSQDITINSFLNSYCKKDQKDTSDSHSIGNPVKEKKECTRCLEANAVMLQQQNKIDELCREVHTNTQKIVEKEEEIKELKEKHLTELKEMENKYEELKREDDEKYDQLKHSLIDEDELFHHLNDQMSQQDIIIEQNKEINQRLQEYNNYIVRLMSKKNDDSSEFFKIVLTQQAKSIETMMVSNKSNSQLYSNLLRVVENKTLPQMKLIPKSDVSCQTNFNYKTSQSDQSALVTSPSKGRDIFQSLENNSITKRNKAKQMNLTPPNYFNGNLTSRKSTPTLEYQKELLRRKMSKNLDFNSGSKVQQSYLDLDKIYISPQRDHNEDEEGQRCLYTFNQRNQSSVEKEVIASFYNPNKHSNDEFSLLSYNNLINSQKKSPVNDKEISLINRSINQKQNGSNNLRSPWRTMNESKKKDSQFEESQITEIDKEDDEEFTHKKPQLQSSSAKNFRNFFDKKDNENEQDFQIQQYLNLFNRENREGRQQQFGEVKQFDPFSNQTKQAKYGHEANLSEDGFKKCEITKQQGYNLNSHGERTSKSNDRNQFTYSNNLQQKIVTALQKKGLDQQKATATVSKNMENYKKQKKCKPQHSSNNLACSNSQERVQFANNVSSQHTSKTPKKKINIDLNINLSGNMNTFQTKSTSHQGSSTGQNKYFSYNCASAKNSSQLYLNQQKQQQSQEKNHFSESSERLANKYNQYSISQRGSNNTSKDERNKQSQQQSFLKTHSSSQLLDLNTYKVNNNNQAKKNDQLCNRYSLNQFNDQQRQSGFLNISNNHTNENCDSLFHKRMIQYNGECSGNNNSKFSNKSTNNGNKSLTNNSNSSTFNNPMINGIHANYFSQQHLYKNTPKQIEVDTDIINSYQLNQIMDKKNPQSIKQQNQKLTINTQHSASNEPQINLNEKRSSFFDNNQHTHNYSLNNYQQYRSTTQN